MKKTLQPRLKYQYDEDTDTLDVYDPENLKRYMGQFLFDGDEWVFSSVNPTFNQEEMTELLHILNCILLTPGVHIRDRLVLLCQVTGMTIEFIEVPPPPALPPENLRAGDHCPGL